MLTYRYTIALKVKLLLVNISKIRYNRYLYSILKVTVIFNLTLVNLIDYLLFITRDIF